MAKRKPDKQKKPGSGTGGTHALSQGPITGFKPYQPPKPPPGSYDPALDAQLGAANRGLGDLRQDVTRQNLRGVNDYEFAKGDLALAQGRGTEDWQSQVAALHRSYQQLQRRQAEGARHNGVASAGIALMAAQKRAENEQLDRQPIDLNYKRFTEDNTRAGGRLDVNFQRDWFDRNNVQLTRAEREGTAFGLDVAAQKGFQATQSGMWQPPQRGEKGGIPKNEHVGPNGQHYQERVVGNMIVRYDQFGKVISRRARSGKSKAW